MRQNIKPNLFFVNSNIVILGGMNGEQMKRNSLELISQLNANDYYALLILHMRSM